MSACPHSFITYIILFCQIVATCCGFDCSERYIGLEAYISTRKDSTKLQVLHQFCTRVDQLGWLSGEHPGGKKSIMMFAGKDATEEFDMLHDRKVIKKYGIDEGTVELKGTIKKWAPRCSRHLFAPGRAVWGILEEAADWVRCSWGKTSLRDWDSFISRPSQ